jgi:hypothetical protein
MSFSMVKLRWDKADEYHPDPGAMIDPPEPTTPSRWVGPRERDRRNAELAKERRELEERSEQHDLDLLKLGLERRIRYSEERGIPLSLLDRVLLNLFKQRPE